MSEDWTQAWQPTVDVVGQDFSGGIESTAIDEIERATIRRYCEPLEFSCPLHYDEEVARAHGYAGILAPHSGVSSTWIDPGIWRPGEGTRYPVAHQHVDIPRVRGPVMPEPPEAPTTAGFATDIEIEYHQPPVVGDRLTVKGRELMSCLPRETRVGRGAFMIWQRQVVNQRGELVALLRNGGYRYVAFETPRPSASAPPPRGGRRRRGRGRGSAGNPQRPGRRGEPRRLVAAALLRGCAGGRPGTADHDQRHDRPPRRRGGGEPRLQPDPPQQPGLDRDRRARDVRQQRLHPGLVGTLRPRVRRAGGPLQEDRSRSA